MKKQNKPLFCRKHLIIPVLLVFILLIAGIGGVSAKYVKDVGSNNALVRAKEFYFSSDLLTEKGESYTLNPGTASVTFELRNHDDELRYSENALGYNVVVNGDAIVSPASGSLEGNQISNTSITLSNLVEGQSYTVTATGSAGYTKTLSATFTVRSQSKGAYHYLERDPSGAFVLLTVWTENVSGEVSISFPAGLIPDTTDQMLAGIQNYSTEQNKYQAVNNQAAGSLGVYSSHTYRFFLETPFTQYNANAFTVTVGKTTATEKTPN